MKFPILSILALAFLVQGCVVADRINDTYINPYRIRDTVDDYMEVANSVELGMSKQQVVEILGPTQTRLRNTEIKQSDHYRGKGLNVEILYFRSGWQRDGLVTDDEFTPYIFNDGALVAIGWEILGGPKSQGQAPARINIQQHP
jgi:hypothetical protein